MGGESLPSIVAPISGLTSGGAPARAPCRPQSHHITTNIARILLEEQLGYDVEIVDSRSPRFSIPRIGGCGPKQGVESCCDQTIEPATCAGTSNRKRADLPDAFANLEVRARWP